MIREDEHRDPVQVDLAIVQIVTTILITIGATIFAVGIGFDIAIPSVIDNIVEESTPFELPDDAREALNNYAFMLTSAGVVMMIVGIIYGSARLSRIKKRLKQKK